jgi:hypothetical protein
MEPFDYTIIPSRSAIRNGILLRPDHALAWRVIATNRGNPAPHLRPLADALEKGLYIAMQPVGSRLRKPTPRPALVLLGDDLACAEGPDAFSNRSLRLMLDGARAVLVQVAAPDQWHYSAMADIALAFGKAVIIETQPSHETEWLAAVSRFAPSAALRLITPRVAQYAAPGGTA